MPAEESTSASANQAATEGIRSKLAGIFAAKKHEIRTAFVILDAVAIVFVIILRVFSCVAHGFDRRRLRE
jgi:hypothetical protein